MPKRPVSFSDQVYALVRQVPPGRVVSYGAVAALLGKPRAARAVGQALRALPDGNDVPWWRVVNQAGTVSSRPVINAKPLQEALLRKERIRFNGSGAIDWVKYGWDGPPR
jgi:methylated-DNA-protein-cysteine methyltransferase-like protein